MGPQNSWAYWAILQYQDIAKNLTKGQFVQNLKNGSDIYEHVHNNVRMQNVIRILNVCIFVSLLFYFQRYFSFCCYEPKTLTLPTINV